MTTLWDTTGTAVVKALAAERRTGGGVTSGLALTLVVVQDEKDTADVEAAVRIAASRHPMRVLAVIRRQVDAPVPRLDAEVEIGGRYGPVESVVLRMYGRLALHAESVTLPLLAPDAPVVTWWDGEAPERIAYDPLGVFAERRIT
ncbi:MAG: glucose-6-phosphate dehydrogenase assembly protein OpcA, partial [Jatrophihabitantaceae bacterium]